jgi:predicted amidophosphoribosyltransferase
MRTGGTARSGVRRWMAGAAGAVVSLFFPGGCRIGDSLLVTASRVPICGECLKHCRACQMKTYAFERARSFGVYENELVRAILLLKWERIEPLGRWFADRLVEVVRPEGAAMEADLVVPVPLHWDREKERGYNQAGLISKPLAKRLGLTHQELLLEAPSRQAGDERGRAVGVGPWRFCHTSGQPS